MESVRNLSDEDLIRKIMVLDRGILEIHKFDPDSFVKYPDKLTAARDLYVDRQTLIDELCRRQFAVKMFLKE